MPIARLSREGRQIDIAYAESGEGFPVLLVHGFASNKETNWINTGWFKALAASGFRAIALDNRGHGASTKFYRETDYSLDAMAGDALALLDCLGIERAHVCGYSMGARICCMLALAHGKRIGKAVFSGNGWAMVEGSGDWTPVRDALLADSLGEVADLRARAFRVFADQTKSDRQALAACVAGIRQKFTLGDLGKIANPVLVAVGSKDTIAGSGEKLAAALPHGEFFEIPDRDHMRAVGDKQHIAAVLAFLLRQVNN